MARTSESAKQKQSVIFLHIHKTAGNTLNKVIDHQFKRTSIFTRHPYYPQKFNDEFKKLSEAQRERIRAIKGHMFFGLHEFLPQPSTYITILRDPVDRIISYYYHLRRNPKYKKLYYNDVTSQPMSLEDFVRSGLAPVLENGQTRLLSGVREVDTANEILKRAKKNLQEHFTVVGLTERFDETLILLKRVFGWRNIFYTKLNVGTNRSKKEDIPKETLSVIEKHNELDIELYRYAQERFNEQIRQQGPSFERELREFRSLNKLYGNLYKFLRPMTTGFRHWLKTRRAG